MRRSFEQRSNNEEYETMEQENANIEKMINFIAKSAENLREQGVPVNDDCRIDINGFKGVYDAEEVERDERNTIKRIERMNHKNFSEIEKEKPKKTGEQMEIFATAIFHKFLGKDFIVARTSHYDDTKNGVDNIILDKKTGETICSFDEVGDTHGERFKRKREKVLDRNIDGGAKLKYGLGMENNKIVLEPKDNIPIFYLALESNKIKNGMKEFSPSFEEKTEEEKVRYEYFLTSIRRQISILQMEFEDYDLDEDQKNT